eukprot:TRINITY_DN2088_c0_g1_i1.p1 TRINITY_DN2088_c0_g1~~TRINITY_DN2088_c0_g1_i1.p1  ORF type:complete len:426 (+),score=88.77 TRINITY_DN2088_c0_g1_i1:54-1331(+)
MLSKAVNKRKQRKPPPKIKAKYKKRARVLIEKDKANSKRKNSVTNYYQTFSDIFEKNGDTRRRRRKTLKVNNDDKQIIKDLMEFENGEILGSMLDIMRKEEVYPYKYSLYLVGYFKNGGMMEHMIKEHSKKCIQEQKRSSTIFRTDSLATLMTFSYFSFYGKPYLQEVILPIIELIKSTKLNLQKADSKKIKKIKSKLIKTIDESSSKIPMKIVKLIRDVCDVSVDYFPDSQYIIICSTFFLRFVCIAMIFPKKFRIKIDVSVEEQKKLIYFSKFLQKTVTDSMNTLNIDSFKKLVHGILQLDLNSLPTYRTSNITKQKVLQQTHNHFSLHIDQLLIHYNDNEPCTDILLQFQTSLENHNPSSFVSDALTNSNVDSSFTLTNNSSSILTDESNALDSDNEDDVEDEFEMDDSEIYNDNNSNNNNE